MKTVCKLTVVVLAMTIFTGCATQQVAIGGRFALDGLAFLHKRAVEKGDAKQAERFALAMDCLAGCLDRALDHEAD